MSVPLEQQQLRDCVCGICMIAQGGGQRRQLGAFACLLLTVLEGGGGGGGVQAEGKVGITTFKK